MKIEIPTLKSLYIEMYFEDTLLGSATATLVSETKESHCSVITARHNVTGRHHDTNECLHNCAAVPDSVTIYFHSPTDFGSTWVPINLSLFRDDGSQKWIEHPQLGERADIVALNVHWGRDVLKHPYYFDLDLDRIGMAIGPAENVSVIGFPFGIWRGGRFPVWATGFLAQDMSLISDEEPMFLIDCRSRRGQSGSPVIAFRPFGFRQEQDGRATNTLSVKKVWEFLGIYTGRVHPESDLGVVWHVDAIRDLHTAASRDYEERNRHAAKSTSGAVGASFSSGSGGVNSDPAPAGA